MTKTSIYLPRSPDIGSARLTAYLAADPVRLIIYNAIRDRLGPAGTVGDCARFYIIGNAARRAVFRGILIALAIKVPGWAKDCLEARSGNRAFITANRDDYRTFRRCHRACSGASPSPDGIR